VPEALTLPIVKEPLTLTYWSELNSSAFATMKSYGEVAAYKELEKLTGIHLDFQHPPQGQSTEQFNLVVASGKYPDVIEYNWLTDAPGGPARFIKDGVILRLNNLVDQYAPNLKKLLTDHPEWRRMIVTDEGDLYSFPFLRSDPLLLVFTGPAIRADWLEKLGLKVPTTVDEWHDVLVAFKDKDPNANNKKDEIPFTPWKSGFGTTANGRGAFLNHAFIGAWGIAMEWYQENGQVKYGALQPEFKEFLKVMAQWYKEKLIDPDYLTTDSKTLDAKWTNNQFGSGVMNAGSGIGKYLQLMRPKDPKWNLVGAPYPVLKAGDKPVLGQMDSPYPGVGAAITSSNKHVAETVKYLDYAYSDAGHMLFNFGIEGVSYKMVNGYPTYTDEVMKNPQGLPIAQAMWRYFRAVSNGPFLQDPRYNVQYLGMKEQQDALKVWTQPENKKQMPPVTPTRDESKKFATIMADINTRYDEVYNKIVTGALPVEAWDQFIKDIKQMGIDEAIQLRQAALDRYNQRA
jgi:putative aldouronate transport system substrate-binding protein